MFDGASYNIGPAYTEDLGVSFGFNPMNLPYTGMYGGCYTGGFTGARDSMILRGPLTHDVVDIPRKEKDKRIWKNILTFAALGALCIAGYKVGKFTITKCYNVIKNLFKKKP